MIKIRTVKYWSKKIVLWICVLTFSVAGLGLGTYVAAETFHPSSQWALLWQVIDIVKAHFVNKDIQTEDLIQGAIEGSLKALNDPYSRYLPPKGFSEMKIRLDGELQGIGIEIGIKDDHLMVISPIEGTPASKAGLQPLDQILKVDGESMEGISLQEAVSKIRGTVGSKVILTILRSGQEKPFDVEIIRDVIKISSVDKTQRFDGNIGYVRLVTFESKAAYDELEEAVAKLDKPKKLDALILDLRYNGGGLLDNAVKISSYFMDEGAVVHTVNREGSRETLSIKNGGVKFKRPLVVLINHASASASEILAGAIQDHKRGVILGQKSFGKASVQNIFPLADGSAVLITVAKYLTPNGSDITEKGIVPNIEVEIPTANLEKMRQPGYVYTYDDDLQLQEALKLLRAQLVQPTA